MEQERRRPVGRTNLGLVQHFRVELPDLLEDLDRRTGVLELSSYKAEKRRSRSVGIQLSEIVGRWVGTAMKTGRSFLEVTREVSVPP